MIIEYFNTFFLSNGIFPINSPVFLHCLERLYHVVPNYPSAFDFDVDVVAVVGVAGGKVAGIHRDFQSGVEMVLNIFHVHSSITFS